MATTLSRAPAGGAMADKLSELPPSVRREGVASLVAGLKGFLVWLGGSLASITAIFHASGYLITRAHLSMLGLHGVLDFDHHDIVQEGGKFFLKFQQPLCIGNLLYAESGSAPCPGSMMQGGADELKKALLGRDDRLLNNAFQELVFGFALAYLTWRTTQPWRWRGWYAAPSLVAAALYLILLPMDHGVLQRPITYPRITLTPEETPRFR